ncbi:hypothetical protein J6590_102643 [Homalodisca vitripennis]|nr:hypothetical protein J6590_102643 [Homalodisca vitripennis]
MNSTRTTWNNKQGTDVVKSRRWRDTVRCRTHPRTPEARHRAVPAAFNVLKATLSGFTSAEGYIECYIAEQNLVGVAIGAACRDRTIAFASTFATFFTRAFDQYYLVIGVLVLRRLSRDGTVISGQWPQPKTNCMIYDAVTSYGVISLNKCHWLFSSRHQITPPTTSSVLPLPLSLLPSNLNRAQSMIAMQPVRLCVNNFSENYSGRKCVCSLASRGLKFGTF